MEIVGIDPLEFVIDTQPWKHIWNPRGGNEYFLKLHFNIKEVTDMD